MAEQPVVSAQKRRSVATPFRLIFIGLVVLLMASAVYVLGTSWAEGQEVAQLSSPSAGTQAVFPAEPVRLDVGSLGYLAEMDTYPRQRPAGAATRSLEDYYNRRAYNGAPPWIPHEVTGDDGIGGKSCLNCHASGSYAPEMGLFAPIVPHPNLVACTQCHVAVQEDGLFQVSNWQRPAPLAVIDAALVGAPPPMPHPLQLRENCAACHAGAAAPPEIATDHIERASCQQCHVASQTDDVWVRAPQEVP
ncbi:MAG: hypothetical protein KJZ86_10370 [Caldilineaceae bacterium]|nr:hypothetical protein [Caldilineaceae bacterium]HRJ43058.1 multiheme c-type cytochrome [Caldilineaceae bacterium]